ncbi:MULTISPECIES: hypothetical protein [unclassified Serratia (in: enterobacteria)]|uniref:hypothetical protein n=1 Tax=unclassified Serratia (in: enterobacteria) TaxID=2647522 RepID=UPI000ACCC8F8|nr:MULTISPECIES: hypothetical protein [unclassified Serratia (in: enterobacteria)]
MSQELLANDDLFVSHMQSELQQQLIESQAEKEVRWHGAQHESPSLTWSEFAGNFN